MKKADGLFDESLFGIGLVLTSLLFDGLVSTQQDKNHQSTKRDFAYHTMFYSNIVILIGNFLLYAYSVQVHNDLSLQKCLDDPILMRDTLLISFLGAVGQIFVFLTISLFDNYKLSIVTTSRKCLSVVVSAFIFDHKFTSVQWLGAVIVMLSTCAEVYLGKNKKKNKSH